MKRINTTQRSPGIQIAVLLLLLSYCTSGEQETGIGRPLEITAEIATPVTRATDAHESDYDKRTFVANDQINIYSGASASGKMCIRDSPKRLRIAKMKVRLHTPSPARPT